MLFQQFGDLQTKLQGRSASPFGEKNEGELAQVFQEFGMSPEEAAINAKLHANLSVGGRTAHAQSLIDRFQRAGLAPQGSSEEISARQEGAPKEDPMFQGLTPKEKVTLRKEVAAKNEPKLIETNDKIQSLDNEKADFDELGALINRGNLPNRWVAAWFTKDGSLTPVGQATLSADAAQFQKVIVRQLSHAKDTFGARVTNFDASKFLEGLPSFLNSPEGMQQILEGLQKVNEINRLYNQEIIDQVEKAGGSQNIRFSTAQSRAQKQLKPVLDGIRQEYLRGWPSARENTGKEIEDLDTKKTYMSIS